MVNNDLILSEYQANLDFPTQFILKNVIRNNKKSIGGCKIVKLVV